MDCNFLYGWMLRYSAWVVFNNFFLTDATDRSKISSDQKRFFSLYAYTPFHFLRTLPLKGHFFLVHNKTTAFFDFWDIFKGFNLKIIFKLKTFLDNSFSILSTINPCLNVIYHEMLTIFRYRVSHETRQ